MKKDQKSVVTTSHPVKMAKSLTGITGFDEITTGGLPKNRPTLIVGKPGCGKTVMGMEFLVNGILKFDEPGVFMTFEEITDELVQNADSFNYDLPKLQAKKQLYLEHVQIDNEDARKTGNYNIEGLFVRLGQAIDKIKAKRVVLDSLDTLFYGLDHQILRSEFKRLFSWLKEKKVTAIITAEVGDSFLTRNGSEEYIADCIIQLDNRATNQITIRRMRILKYRGSSHGNNEYPFIIDEHGVTVFPTISEAIEQKSSSKRISSGIPELDEMLGKKGFFIGSSILISGTAGTGKTSISASFAYNACLSKERCLFCAFEEAPNQVKRNMKSIGFELEAMVKSGLLHFYYSRPSLQNLELHFIAIKQIISEIRPTVVVLDPITNLMTEGPNSDIRSMLTRFVDYLKIEQIMVMFTAAITVGSIERNPSDEGISSMVDTWIMVQDIEVDAVRTRSLCVMKSRGMKHSNEIRRFIISDKGINLPPIVKKENETSAGAKRNAREQKNLSTSRGSRKTIESTRNDPQ